MAEAKWYIVHAYSNFEKKVAATIIEQSERKNIRHLIEDMQVPTEEVVEVARGKKKTVEQRYLPGYVLMKAELTDELYHLVKETPKVSGFLGADGGKKPLPVRQKEVDRLLGVSNDAPGERARPKIAFEIGEHVRVNDGPFQGFEGSVEEIDEGSGRLKVTVTIFGRATPVDLEFDQVVKV